MTTKKKIIFFGLYAILLFLVCESLCRFIFPPSREKSPFFHPRERLYQFYPDLKTVGPREGDTFDILVLGSSVMAPNISAIEQLMYQEYAHARPLRIYNLGTPAHTSLDHYYKYNYLRGRKFDLVMFYEGINEARANNCPDDVFRDDYSHYSWYRDVNIYARHPEIKYVLLPYVLDCLWVKILDRFMPPVVIPTHSPPPEWLDHGAKIKTAAAFRRNLERIVKLAEKKHERLLLMTFAFSIPADYTYADFLAKRLDYATHLCPIELWGKPENVRAAIMAHNAIIKDIAEQHSAAVLFIDQAALIPGGREYFNDICHLTPTGAEEFVKNITPLMTSLSAG